MEQLLHIERLKATTLSGVTVLAISPDPPAATRELVETLRRKKGLRLTHRFLSDPSMAAISRCGARNTKGAMTVRPLWLLFDRQGREVWRFREKHTRMTPTDSELETGLLLLKGP